MVTALEVSNRQFSFTKPQRNRSFQQARHFGFIKAQCSEPRKPNLSKMRKQVVQAPTLRGQRWKKHTASVWKFIQTNHWRERHSYQKGSPAHLWLRHSEQPAPPELANAVGPARLKMHGYCHARLLGTKATAEHWTHTSPCTQKPPQCLLANGNWKGPIIYRPALQRELHSEAVGSLLNKAKCVPEGRRWEKRSLLSPAVGYIMGTHIKNPKSHMFS